MGLLFEEPLWIRWAVWALSILQWVSICLSGFTCSIYYPCSIYLLSHFVCFSVYPHLPLCASPASPTPSSFLHIRFPPSMFCLFLNLLLTVRSQCPHSATLPTEEDVLGRSHIHIAGCTTVVGASSFRRLYHIQASMWVLQRSELVSSGQTLFA